ncbi:hypothetical protein Bbelb_038370 [Branchiostoma belcheri]|nr:hypothetical protein Bbelb_038370 [Branchiostoma belcheri]
MKKAFDSVWRDVTSVNGCGGNLTAPSGGPVTSPNYPGKYGNNENCEWSITVPAGSIIHLTFDSFNTEGNFDFLTIYDGASDNAAEMERLTGDQPQIIPIISTSNTLFLRFTSDGSFSRQGFQFSYTSSTAGQCWDPGVPANGNRDNNSNFTSGQTVRYTCMDGSLDYETGRPGFDSGSYPTSPNMRPDVVPLGKPARHYYDRTHFERVFFAVRITPPSIATPLLWTMLFRAARMKFHPAFQSLVLPGNPLLDQDGDNGSQARRAMFARDGLHLSLAGNHQQRCQPPSLCDEEWPMLLEESGAAAEKKERMQGMWERVVRKGVQVSHEAAGVSSVKTRPKGSHEAAGVSSVKTRPKGSDEAAGVSSVKTRPKGSDEAAGVSSVKTRPKGSDEAAGVSSVKTRPKGSDEAAGVSSVKTRPKGSHEAAGVSSVKTRPKGSDEAAGVSSVKTRPKGSDEAAGVSSVKTRPKESDEAAGVSSVKTRSKGSDEAAGVSSVKTRSKGSHEAAGVSSVKTRPKGSHEAAGVSSVKTRPKGSHEAAGVSSVKTRPKGGLVARKESRTKICSEESETSQTRKEEEAEITAYLNFFLLPSLTLLFVYLIFYLLPSLSSLTPVSVPFWSIGPRQGQDPPPGSHTRRQAFWCLAMLE